MVSLSQITVGGLTSFMVYAAWVGISVGGEIFTIETLRLPFTANG